MINLTLHPISTSPSPGAVEVRDTANTMTHRVLLAIDSMPWALDPNQPFPDDYADFTPMGECPTHGLEPHRAECHEVGTGYDICLASVFACGNIDPDSIF